MKISIGPALFEWGKNGVRDFYRRMAFETDAEILYIGEVVCSKRHHLEPDELGELARELTPSGKQIVLSTLGLVMNEAEQGALRRTVAVAAEQGLMIEANDMAAVAVGEGTPMVAGPHITTYNPETLDFLASVGVKRFAAPVELSGRMIGGLIAQHGAGVEAEVFAYGKLPLTFSARCYTARAFRLSKANCQFKCGDYPDGMAMKTQEGEAFLTINGIQTMSDRLYNLADQVERLNDIGVSIVRLSPQSQSMQEIVALWRQRVDGRIGGEEAMARLAEINGGQPFCNGYFHGRAGLDFLDPATIQAANQAQ